MTSPSVEVPHYRVPAAANILIPYVAFPLLAPRQEVFLILLPARPRPTRAASRIAIERDQTKFYFYLDNASQEGIVFFFGNVHVKLWRS